MYLVQRHCAWLTEGGFIKVVSFKFLSSIIFIRSRTYNWSSKNENEFVISITINKEEQSSMPNLPRGEHVFLLHSPSQIAFPADLHQETRRTHKIKNDSIDSSWFDSLRLPTTALITIHLHTQVRNPVVRGGSKEKQNCFCLHFPPFNKMARNFSHSEEQKPPTGSIGVQSLSMR